MHRTTHHPGFTLLELLVAVTLSGALAAIGVLRWSDMMSGWRLGAAVRQIVLELKVARMQAVSENTDRRVRLPVPGSSYLRERRESSAYVADGRATALPEGVDVIDCTAKGSAITFRPLGHASTFGTIRLRNEDGAERSIVVDMAGRLRVQ
jgi:prepilin-type N-terminal cleavage/methylation domain-containing protein